MATGKNIHITVRKHIRLLLADVFRLSISELLGTAHPVVLSMDRESSYLISPDIIGVLRETLSPGDLDEMVMIMNEWCRQELYLSGYTSEERQYIKELTAYYTKRLTF
ncbi:hypothetical protein GZD23_004486 [Salmonella enterica subsp. enterica]|nr:hypothetical protein [Salmonella enterica subsp. salamae]ECF6040775.1 hypothetical protein [Salmonella enterica subsp. salamae]EDB2515916.1 hypothetical protein [Salmonella enterica]EEC4477556.1 hypothetical protein [Salmonella enterica]EEG3130718.1 hypothetical protein [Salmonella enterica subsp. enterica serovar Nima]